MNVSAWKCDVCGYVHQGDGPPDTCPVCGVDSDLFSRMEIQASAPAPASAPRQWRCTVCGYVHEGDQPPEICPVCGVTRDLFEPVEEPGPHAATAAGGDVAGAEHLVVVGAGIAGVTAVEHARGAASGLRITLVSKERELPYYRLNLSRLLAGEVDEAQLGLHDRAWLDERRIEWVEDEVVAIDREARALTLRAGETLSYDRLILANGSHPFVPPILGATREGVHSFRTLADARALVSQAERGRRCLCIGGGLLGLETAGALARRGAEVTVLEGFGWLLPRQLPEAAGLMLARHLEGLGVKIRCDVRVKEIIGDERVAGVRLDDGEEIAGELVVIATGVRSNSYLARQAGLAVKAGVVVDDAMASSDPRVFAAGDVTEHRGVVYGIWPASFAQGVVAGVNAAGGVAEFSGLPPATSLKVLEVDMLSVGQVNALDGSYKLAEDQPRDGVYRRLVCRDGRLVGAVLYGETTLGGALREAVEQGTQLLELPAPLRDGLSGLVDACGGAR